MNFSLQPFPLPSVRKFDRVRRRNFSETGPCFYYGQYYCMKLALKIVISFFVQNDENLNRNVEHRLLSDDGINCKYTRMLKSSVIMKSEFHTARLWSLLEQAFAVHSIFLCGFLLCRFLRNLWSSIKLVGTSVTLSYRQNAMMLLVFESMLDHSKVWSIIHYNL